MAHHRSDPLVSHSIPKRKCQQTLWFQPWFQSSAAFCPSTACHERRGYLFTFIFQEKKEREKQQKHKQCTTKNSRQTRVRLPGPVKSFSPSCPDLTLVVTTTCFANPSLGSTKAPETSCLNSTSFFDNLWCHNEETPGLVVNTFLAKTLPLSRLQALLNHFCRIRLNSQGNSLDPVGYGSLTVWELAKWLATLVAINQSNRWDCPRLSFDCGSCENWEKATSQAIHWKPPLRPLVQSSLASLCQTRICKRVQTSKRQWQEPLT